MTTAELRLDLSKDVSTAAAQTGPAPSGWWMLPAVVGGAGMWIGLLVLIL